MRQSTAHSGRQRRTRPTQAQIERRRQEVLLRTRVGQPLRVIAKALGVSTMTVARDRDAAVGAVLAAEVAVDDLSVADLPIGSRARTALLDAGVYAASELRSMGAARLLVIRNFGVGCLADVTFALALYGAVVAGAEAALPPEAVAALSELRSIRSERARSDYLLLLRALRNPRLRRAAADGDYAAVGRSSGLSSRRVERLLGGHLPVLHGIVAGEVAPTTFTANR